MAWITISVGSSVGRVARIPGSDCRWQRSGRKNGVEKGYYMNFGLLLLRETPCHMCMYIYICDYYIYIYNIHISYHISYICHVVHTWCPNGIQMLSKPPNRYFFTFRRTRSCHVMPCLFLARAFFAVVEACEFPTWK